MLIIRVFRWVRMPACFLYVVETLYMPMGCAIAFYIVLYASV